MNSLHILLRSLTTEEVRRLRGMRLVGKEAAVYEAIKNRRSQTEIVPDRICKQVGIGTTHFYKITSVVLSKCYKVLCNDEYELFEYLAQRGLDVINEYEINKRGKKLTQEDSQDELKKFAHRIFRIYTNSSIAFANSNLVDRFYHQYVDLLDSTEEDERQFTQLAFRLYKWRLAYETNRKFDEELVTDELQEDIEVVGGNASKKAAFQLYRNRAWHAFRLLGEKQTALNMLKRSLNIYYEDNSLFDETDQQLILNAIAEVYYFNSAFGQAKQVYKHAYQHSSGLFHDSYRHLIRQVELCILRTEYREAEKLLDRHFGLHIKNEHYVISPVACIAYTKLYLRKKELEKAGQYIELARNAIQGRRTKNLENLIELGLLETTLHILTGEMEMVLALYDRNTRYLRQRGYTYANSSYLQYYWVLKVLIQKNRRLETLTARQWGFFALYQRADRAIYGKLLFDILEVDREWKSKRSRR